MSVQYASATGTGNFGATTTQFTELPSIALQPGQYFLIQEASSAAVGAPLPSRTSPTRRRSPWLRAPARSRSSPTRRRSAVTAARRNPAALPQLARIVDLVGYGNANFFEGAGAAPTLSNTPSAARNAVGCTDTDSNGADFSVLTPPGPRNTASPFVTCGGPPTPTNPTRQRRSQRPLGAAGRADDSDRHRHAGCEPDEHRDLGHRRPDPDRRRRPRQPFADDGIGRRRHRRRQRLHLRGDRRAGDDPRREVAAGRPPPMPRRARARPRSRSPSQTPPAPPIEISEIQGAAHISPQVGTTVTTTGIVIGKIGSAASTSRIRPRTLRLGHVRGHPGLRRVRGGRRLRRRRGQRPRPRHRVPLGRGEPDRSPSSRARSPPFSRLATRCRPRR